MLLVINPDNPQNRLIGQVVAVLVRGDHEASETKVAALLGGVVLANLDTQASASASAFAIGIEANPIDTKLLLVSTADKDGRTTSIRAVVQFRPDSAELAINSWRVKE